jgi:hypothetical protein
MRMTRWTAALTITCVLAILAWLSDFRTVLTLVELLVVAAAIGHALYHLKELARPPRDVQRLNRPLGPSRPNRMSRKTPRKAA